MMNDEHNIVPVLLSIYQINLIDHDVLFVLHLLSWMMNIYDIQYLSENIALTLVQDLVPQT